MAYEQQKSDFRKRRVKRQVTVIVFSKREARESCLGAVKFGYILLNTSFVMSIQFQIGGRVPFI